MELYRMKMNLAKMARKFLRIKGKRKTIAYLFVLLIAMMLGASVSAVIVKRVERQRAERELERELLDLETRMTVAIDANRKELQAQLDALTGVAIPELPWYLTLVNAKHPMETDYDLKLVDLQPGYSVDERIVDAAKRMLEDAKKAGLNVVICSAYRSVVRQEQVFNESVQDRLNRGMNYWDAFVDTRLSVAEPGTSEHAMGLALDLVSSRYSELDQRQETTAEAKWLAENCHRYGFILRYPPSKTQITGIIYEPWHYRYVGVEDATKIMELGITLEEYLEGYYGK